MMDDVPGVIEGVLPALTPALIVKVDGLGPAPAANEQARVEAASSRMGWILPAQVDAPANGVRSVWRRPMHEIVSEEEHAAERDGLDDRLGRRQGRAWDR